jgi:hypothetical protein
LNSAHGKTWRVFTLSYSGPDEDWLDGNAVGPKGKKEEIDFGHKEGDFIAFTMNLRQPDGAHIKSLNSVSPDIERFWLGHANRTVGDDYSMLKKNVKFRKQIADKIGVGFELPNSILASVVPHVPKMAVEQAEQAVA